MASEKRPEILYDFLLIDQERLHVLHSQLFPETGRQTDAPETRAAVTALMEVLRRLAYSGMICPDPTVAASGNILLLQGRVGLLDFTLCEGLFALLPEVVPQKDAFSGDLFKRRPTQRPEQKPSEFLKKVAGLVPDSVTVLMKHADMSVWGAVHRKSLFSTSGQRAMQSGPVLAGDWSMLAIVDVPISGSGEGDIDGMSRFADGLLRGLEGMRSVIGMPRNCLGVTPLAVFRRLLASAPFMA